jgi:hypothetical protein
VIGINDLESPDLPDYRPVCVPAAIGLGLGIFSFVAFLHPVLWIWPLCGVITCAYALYCIANSERLLGRTAALCGLFLSLLFGIAAPARTFIYNWRQESEARKFAEEWFAALLAGNVHANLPEVYAQSADLRQSLKAYSEVPEIAALLHLGSRATARHFQTESVTSDTRQNLVEEVFAVTYDEGGKKKSFFIRVPLWRNLTTTNTAPRAWRIQSPEGGYRPQGWN